MYLLYNFLLLSFLILASPFWIYKVLTKEKHRKGFFEKLGIAAPPPLINPSKKGGIHIHAVSVGEVVAAIPFIKELKKRHPEIRLVLSTVTPTGREVACKRLPEVDQIVYFPFDLPWSVRRFLKRIRPDLFISVETELWPNFLRQVKLSGARTLIINGRISPHTFKGYSRIRPFMKKVLIYVDLFCMQSEEDAERVRSIGALRDSVKVTGNMKYDQGFIDIDKQVLSEKRELFGIEEGDRVIIAGSTHRGEDEIILASYRECLKKTEALTPFRGTRNNENFPPLQEEGQGGDGVFSSEKIRLIIVPRHPERTGEIEEIIKRQGLESIKRTALGSPRKDNIPYNPVIIVDTIGELATLYSMATVVIIGGSFISHGGQNPLEALYYRKPVIFGEHMFNFREITEEILKCGAGIQVENSEELSRTLKGLVPDTVRQREMGEKGYQIILRNKGAVGRNLAIVEKLL
ncbi:MAG: 3-deoxy-D-manno-octulosonic acid transferase [Nitrospirae bacterium]|nr:3-deoxy-D-manno-octulosonic acid transferase [Nitrospirota bacterium]MBI5097342.1 3-deoxy-D-manno-octulosonic acid transferase [Nitrospirota bacterium]